jgi:Protein of unknown function (DUF1800)
MPRLWHFVFLAALAAAPQAGLAGANLSGTLSPADLALIDRMTWGVNTSVAGQYLALGRDRWLDDQLHPPPKDRLPAAAQAMINAMPIATKPVAEIAMSLAAQSRTANQIGDIEQKKAAQQAYQQAMNDAARQAATRSLLRDLYSPDQLREKMTWFWFNHFNVLQWKADIRATIGDYEERALRPYALGRFRDLHRLQPGRMALQAVVAGASYRACARGWRRRPGPSHSRNAQRAALSRRSWRPAQCGPFVAAARSAAGSRLCALVVVAVVVGSKRILLSVQASEAPEKTVYLGAAENILIIDLAVKPQIGGLAPNILGFLDRQRLFRDTSNDLGAASGADHVFHHLAWFVNKVERLRGKGEPIAYFLNDGRRISIVPETEFGRWNSFGRSALQFGRAGPGGGEPHEIHEVVLTLDEIETRALGCDGGVCCDPLGRRCDCLADAGEHVGDGALRDCEGGAKPQMWLSDRLAAQSGHAEEQPKRDARTERRAAASCETRCMSTAATSCSCS